jgi:hypothetical protein
MKTSEETDKIGPALTAALAEMVNPPKTQTVKAGNYSYKFAPLPDIIDANRPILAKHKLVAMQSTETMDGLPAVVTMLMHASGQWVQSDPLIIAPKGQGPQDAGGALTYARRYSYSALLGLAADDDDDLHGQTHGGSSQPQTREWPGPQTPQGGGGGKTITEKQAKFLHFLCDKKCSEPAVTTAAIKAKFQVDSFNDIPYAGGKKLIDEMAAKPDYAGQPGTPDALADDLDDVPF